jgi:hypothetical protein
MFGRLAVISVLLTHQITVSKLNNKITFGSLEKSVSDYWWD